MKVDTIVGVFKLRSGENIFGYVLGEQTNPLTSELSMAIYRPIRVLITSMSHPNGGITTNYVPQFYFPFGSPIVLIPKSELIHHDVASPFYERLYTKILGELIVTEEERERRVNLAFDHAELKAILSDTDSLYFDSGSTILQ